MPEIIGLLHSKPQAGSVAAKLTEAHGHFRCHPCVARENAVKGLPRNLQLSRRIKVSLPIAMLSVR